MIRDVISHHAETARDIAVQFEHAGAEGSKEVSFLLERAAAIMDRIAKGETVEPLERPGMPASIFEARGDDDVSKAA